MTLCSVTDAVCHTTTGLHVTTFYYYAMTFSTAEPSSRQHDPAALAVGIATSFSWKQRNVMGALCWPYQNNPYSGPGQLLSYFWVSGSLNQLILNMFCMLLFGWYLEPKHGGVLYSAVSNNCFFIASQPTGQRLNRRSIDTHQLTHAQSCPHNIIIVLHNHDTITKLLHPHDESPLNSAISVSRALSEPRRVGALCMQLVFAAV